MNFQSTFYVISDDAVESCVTLIVAGRGRTLTRSVHLRRFLVIILCACAINCAPGCSDDPVDEWNERIDACIGVAEFNAQQLEWLPPAYEAHQYLLQRLEDVRGSVVAEPEIVVAMILIDDDENRSMIATHWICDTPDGTAMVIRCGDAEQRYPIKNTWQEANEADAATTVVFTSTDYFELDTAEWRELESFIKGSDCTVTLYNNAVAISDPFPLTVIHTAGYKPAEDATRSGPPKPLSIPSNDD